MMQMLQAGGVPPLADAVRAPDADNERGYFEFEKVKHLEDNFDWLGTARGMAVKIISMLLYDLPDGYPYRIIFMRRNLGEILASQRQMLIRRGEADPGPNDDMMGMYLLSHLEKVSRWLQEKEWPVQVCDYNMLIHNPHHTVEQLNDFLDGTLDTKAMMAMIMPELYHQRIK